MIKTDKYLGIPYLHRGRDYKGCDCYGLILLILLEKDIRLIDIEEEYDPNWSFKGKNHFIENAHKEWANTAFPQEFDIVGFKNNEGIMYHAGVMLDSTRFIHTCRAGTVISKITDPQWKKRIVGYFRYKNDKN